MHYKSVPMHQKYLGSTAKEINNNVTCRYYWLSIILIYIFVIYIGILKEQLSGGMYSEHSTFNTRHIACHMIKLFFFFDILHSGIMLKSHLKSLNLVRHCNRMSSRINNIFTSSKFVTFIRFPPIKP